MKSCSKCKAAKSIDDFYNDKQRRDGKTPACKQCMQEYAHANRDQVNAAVRAWRDKNRQRTRDLSMARAKSVKGRFCHTRSQARIRGIPFELTMEQYDKLIESEVCHYMGEPLALTGSGLDRKDSSKGYTVDNCVPCCLSCNQIRGEDNISYEEMLEVASLLTTLRGGVTYALNA